MEVFMKLELINVNKKFGDNLILNNVNLKLTDGNIYGFIGRNGSGKSVLFKIICGFYSPTSGEVTLNDYNYIQDGNFPAETRALIEKPNFLPDLTGFENLRFISFNSKQNK
jgi:ABC-2 type transport system ATP-binding protein